MRILVSNDDGISAPGLWALAGQLMQAGEVVVAAPDREQSATGTAVTLRQPLRVQKATPLIEGVKAFSVEGTPCDSVILALEKLIEEPVDLVVSGINQGLNLGDDMLISGTVGAAIQGYMRGLPAIAVSIPAGYNDWRDAARLAKLLAEEIKAKKLPQDIFLNVNLPELPVSEIKGIRITQPAHKTHIDSVDEGYDGRRKYYWLVRKKLNNNSAEDTDMWALEHGFISITALQTTLFRKPIAGIDEGCCKRLFQNFKQA